MDVILKGNNMKISSSVMPQPVPMQKALLKQAQAPLEALPTQKKESSSAANTKYLQSENVNISKESQEKLLNERKEQELAAEKVHSDDGEEKKEPIPAELEKEEQVNAKEDSGKSELDEAIAELEMKILKLSVEIELLKVKGDKESLKAAEKLEVDLSMLKGSLDAKLKLKLDMSKTNAN